MADSDEFRLKRLKHEQHLSRVFDEVMGLGDFAESSGGSTTSSRSGGQDETKEVDEMSGKEEPQQAEEEEEEEEVEEEEDNSNSSKQDEKIEEPVEEPSLPPVSSSSSDRPSSLTMKRKKGGGSGGAAFDDAVDGLPIFGPEEEDEDWHFALPLGSLEDVDVGKKKRKQIQIEEGNNSSVDDSSAPEPKGGEEEEEEEVQEKGESTESANTSHSSQDPTPENSRDTGIPNQGEDTEDSQEGEKSAAGAECSNPPMCPTVNIKDEPIDEGYDAALLPQSSIKQIKEELEHQEDELRISSVYSVGGANTFVTPTVPPAIPVSTSTAFLIPGRGAVLQAIASLPVRSPAQIPALVPAPPRPPLPPVPGSVRCSGCSKVLLKGQTAFQRKGSTQLFCSTVCLTGHLPPAAKNKVCSQCNKDILQPRDMITIPSDNNTYLNFCGQFCLSVFRHKKKNEKVPDKRADKRLEKKPVENVPEKPVERLEKPFCNVCKVTGKIEHEVTHQGRLHRLCSDACFVTWRKIRQLAMNCCEGCGLYCNSNSGSCQTLTIESTQLNFCGPTCISTYKQSCRKNIWCANCHKMAVVASTIMERDQKGKVQLYCSSACVEQSRPSRHTLSGTAFPCALCKVSAVPQYHLAMVDGTIRNFCSYDCVTLFRKSGQTSQPDLTNGTSSLRDGPKTGLSAGAGSVPPNPQDCSSSAPYTSPYPSLTSVPPLVPPYPAMSSPTVPGQNQASALGHPLKLPEGGRGIARKLTCHQCSDQFSVKPRLYSHQGRISVFCSGACLHQYKIQKSVLAKCESCKQEKLPFDMFSYNQQDVVLCSETCLRLFKQGQKVCYKDHPWRPCSYCCGINYKMLHSHYGGKIEEFCKPDCMSQYTVLFYGMGRCDSCRKQGYMTEKLQCLGSVRNFCNLRCLLQYCYYHFEPSQNTSCNGTGKAPQTPYAPAQPYHSSEMNPVIAGVISLASGSATQPSMSADTARTGTLPNSITDSKNLDHASTQTDAMRVPVPRRRQMKNKSVLCRPFTVDQESMCQLPAPSTESEAVLIRSHERSPSILALDQEQQATVTSTEKEEKVKLVMVPVPIPVPVFIPVPMNMYSQHTPVPVAMPVPLPVPFFVPPQNKDMKDAAVQSEPLAVEEVKQNAQPVVSEEHSSSSQDTGSQVVDHDMCEDEGGQKAVDARLPLTASVERSAESVDAQPDKQPDTQPDKQPDTQPDSQLDSQPDTQSDSQPDTQSDTQPDSQPDSQPDTQPDSQPDTKPPDAQPESTMATEPPPTTSAEPRPPLSPMMDLETDFPSESVVPKSTPKRGVKRPRESSYSRKRGRRRNVSVDRSAVEIPPGAKLNHLYGVKAWKSWVQQRNRQPPESDQMDIKEDILQCDSAELSFALSRFIREVRRPNGETYSPDSIFYLCLGIQQYLFMKGRIENIFTDELYVQFATEISGMLQNWKPKLLASGDVFSSRVEEDYLWECKQLGAYSPIVLLNTLLFFFTKTFRLNTLQQHQNVSFANFTRCSKPCSRAGKVFCLQYRGSTRRDDTERLRKRQTESETHLEILENVSNPLHCPVRLYEFYLSRCPESVKKRTDVFYLQPERNVHTHSPHWYTSQPLEGATLQSMLTRILAVKEVHVAHGAPQRPTSGSSADGSAQ